MSEGKKEILLGNWQSGVMHPLMLAKYEGDTPTDANNVLAAGVFKFKQNESNSY